MRQENGPKSTTGMMSIGSGNGGGSSGISHSGSWNMLGASTMWLGLLTHISFPDTDLPDSVMRK